MSSSSSFPTLSTFQSQRKQLCVCFWLQLYFPTLTAEELRLDRQHCCLHKWTRLTVKASWVLTDMHGSVPGWHWNKAAVLSVFCYLTKRTSVDPQFLLLHLNCRFCGFACWCTTTFILVRESGPLSDSHLFLPSSDIFFLNIGKHAAKLSGNICTPQCCLILLSQARTCKELVFQPFYS